MTTDGDASTGALDFRCAEWEGDTCTNPQVRIPGDTCPSHTSAGDWISASYYNDPEDRICPTFCAGSTSGASDTWSECHAGSETVSGITATGVAVSGIPGLCESSNFQWWINTYTHTGDLFVLSVSAYGAGEPRLQINCDGW